MAEERSEQTAAPCGRKEAPIGISKPLKWALGCLGALVVLVLIVSLVCYLYLSPRLRVRSVIAGFKPITGPDSEWEPERVNGLIDELGGKRRAAGFLAAYVESPESLVEDGSEGKRRLCAAILLGFCDEEAATYIPAMLDSEDKSIRLSGLMAACVAGPHARAALPQIKKLLKHEDKDIWTSARDTLPMVDRKLSEVKRVKGGWAPKHGGSFSPGSHKINKGVSVRLGAKPTPSPSGKYLLKLHQTSKMVRDSQLNYVHFEIQSKDGKTLCTSWKFAAWFYLDIAWGDADRVWVDSSDVGLNYWELKNGEWKETYWQTHRTVLPPKALQRY